MNRFFGVAIIILSLAIAIIPAFTDCQSQGKAIQVSPTKTVEMKCHWTAQGAIATGAPLALVGAMMVATKRKESRRILAVIGASLGVVAILLPTQLIGVCQSGMPCHTTMQPSLVALGSLAIVTSLGNWAFVREPER